MLMLMGLIAAAQVADTPVAAAGHRPPAVYRYTTKSWTEQVTDPCGDFSVHLDGQHNCSPVTRTELRSRKVPIFYDVAGQRGELPPWVVERRPESEGDPATTVAPIRGLYEVTTTDAATHATTVERVCFEAAKDIEALFQAHRGASCGTPDLRIVTSEDVEIAGPCGRGSAKLTGDYDETQFRLVTKRVLGPLGGSGGAVLVTGRRLSPTCAAPAEPRW